MEVRTDSDSHVRKPDRKVRIAKVEEAGGGGRRRLVSGLGVTLSCGGGWLRHCHLPQNPLCVLGG